MNTKISLVVFSLAILFTGTALHAQSIGVGITPYGSAYRNAGPFRGPYHRPEWQADFMPVPEIVTMHCPMLEPGQGVLVQRVHRGGMASVVYDLEYGDILLTVGDEKIFGLASLPAMPGEDLTVLRRGQVVPVAARAPEPQRDATKARRAPWNRFPLASSRGVVAKAFSSSNESVSVTQHGETISLEMSLPDLDSRPIRFQGTREQIERDVEASDLSPAARQRVLDAIR